MVDLSANGRRRIYRVLVRVALADGIVDPSEVAVLRRWCAELGLDPQEARAIEKEPPGAALAIGKRPAERALLARGMVEVAAADGILHPREEKLLLKMAKAVGLPEENLNTALVDALERVRDHAERTQAPPAAPAQELADVLPAAGVPRAPRPTDNLPDVFVYEGGEWPDAVDGAEVFTVVAKALESTGRFSTAVVALGRRAGHLAIEVCVEPEESMFGAGYRVTLRLLDGEGTEQERYAEGVVGPPSGVLLSAEMLAYKFARPADYPSLMEQRGVIGDNRHPSVKAVDPSALHGLAMAAFFNAEPRGLIDVAQSYLGVAEHTAEIEYLLLASEMLALGGEGSRAAQVLVDGLERFKPEPLRTRLAGLRGLSELGCTELGRMLLWLGKACSSGGEGQRVLTVFNRLSDACGVELVGDLTHFQAVLTDPAALGDVIGAPFGSRGVKLMLLGMVFDKALSGDSLLGPGQIMPLVHEVRVYLEPMIGQKSFQHLVEKVEQPDGGLAFVRKLLHHVGKQGFVGDARYHEADWLIQDDLAQARGAFADLTRERPDSWLAWDALARVHSQLNDVESAIACWSHAIGLAPDQVRPRLGRATLCIDHTGDAIQAEADLRHVLELDPYHPAAHTLLGMLFGGPQQNDEEAIRSYLMAVRISPVPMLHYNLGTCLLNAARFEQAIPHFGETLRERPDFAECWINRGICHYRLGIYDRAAYDLDRGAGVNPEILIAFGYRGLAKAALGDPGAATDLLHFVQHGPQGEVMDDVRAALARLGT